MTARPEDLSDGLPAGRRLWAMAALLLGTMMAVLDGSMTNTALPTIARDLQIDAALSIWVVNAYQLAIVTCLLPCSSMGDIYGHKRVYLIGLIVFFLATGACVLAPSFPLLVAARIVQGLGAAGIMSVNGALVRLIHPRAQLGRGIGMIAFMVSVTSTAGPTIASAILSVASWSWLFSVNLLLGVVALALSWRGLPTLARQPHRYDWISAILCACAFGSMIISLDGLGHGAPLLAVAAGILVASALGAVLLRRQNRTPMPMLAVDLFRLPLFALSVATSVCSFAASTLGQISLPFYFVETLGRSQVEAGLLMTPWPVFSAVTAVIAGRLADRYPVHILGCLGMGFLASGLFLLAMLPADPSAWNIAWRMAFCGIGFALFQSPNNRTLMSSAPRERSGAASGVLATARLTGQTIGALLAALMFNLMGGATGGAGAAILVGAAAAALAGGISALRRVDAARTP